jgi:hypothetical protein
VTPSALANFLAELAARPERYAADRAPHRRASALVLPDGKPAPEVLRAWAAFDDHYPTYLSGRRSDQRIATRAGKVLAKPMSRILKDVCIDSIRDELEGDDETLDYLRELVAGFVDEFPGYGVILEPRENPDRLLWFGPRGEATCLWYDNDAFERREKFGEWVAGLFD